LARKIAGTISGIGIDYPQAPRAQDVPLQNSRRLYEVLRAGKFVLLAPEAAKPTIEGWHDHVVLASPIDATMPWTLVRPDAHLAWHGEPSTLPHRPPGGRAVARGGPLMRLRRTVIVPAALAQVLMLTYFVVINWVDLFPWNNLDDAGPDRRHAVRGHDRPGRSWCPELRRAPDALGRRRMDVALARPPDRPVVAALRLRRPPADRGPSGTSTAATTRRSIRYRRRPVEWCRTPSTSYCRRCRSPRPC
jgi:hypothetical protein